jgi:hypothetical protein
MPGPKKYFIQEHLHRETYHGGIGNIDVEKVLVSLDYKAIEFPGYFNFSLKAKWQRFLYLFKMFGTVAAGDLVVFQFPLHARIHNLLVKLLRIKGVHMVCLIADIDGLRINDAAILAKEKKALRRFSIFISHNARMSQWIRSVKPNANIAEIRFFDFLTTPVNRPRKKAPQIVFAGNLAKSPFIQHLEQLAGPCPNTTFFIYGPDYPAQLPFPKNAVNKGIFPPYEIVHHLEGSFGLVWDGPHMATCSGIFGDYLAYNSPHKLSLYIMAGIPLIVPKMSASAGLVEQYGIGCTINRLADIETVINTISDAAYEAMVENTRSLADDISKGKRLQQALHQLEKTLYEN